MAATADAKWNTHVRVVPSECVWQRMRGTKRKRQRETHKKS